MDIEEHIKHWFDSANHDLETAEDLFRARKFDWCLFLGHLVLEKALKAFYVRDNKNQLPPRTHNLLRLAENTSLVLNDDQKIFLDEVNDFNLEVRYPEFKREFYQYCTKEYATSYFTRIKEFYQWLQSQMEHVQL